MQRTCGSCGRDPGTGSFCQQCGSRLADASEAADPRDQSRAPQPATPPPTEGASAQPVAVATRRRGLKVGCLIVGFIVLAIVGVGSFVAWRYVHSRLLPSIQGLEQVADQLDSATLVPGPPGPCYDLEVGGGLVIGWVEVSCQGPRDVEAFFWAEFRDEPFPGDEYLASGAADTCTEAFTAYVGTAVGRSQYALDWLVPSAGTWAGGDREAVCLVVSGTGSPLTGTVKGSAQ